MCCFFYSALPKDIALCPQSLFISFCVTSLQDDWWPSAIDDSLNSYKVIFISMGRMQCQLENAYKLSTIFTAPKYCGSRFTALMTRRFGLRDLHNKIRSIFLRFFSRIFHFFSFPCNFYYCVFHFFIRRMGVREKEREKYRVTSACIDISVLSF